MKKVLALILALCMVMALCACGQNAAPAATEEPAAADAPAADASAETDIAWPEAAVEFVIPANPGGDTDLTSRGLAASLTDPLGQPVSVLNMAGGSGTVAINEILSREADG